jgi:hypothetical protein
MPVVANQAVSLEAAARRVLADKRAAAVLAAATGPHVDRRAVAMALQAGKPAVVAAVLTAEQMAAARAAADR